MAARKAPVGNMYQLKVTLKGSKPPIWRRVQVPGDITLYRLHEILQVVMGWYDCHLFAFGLGDTEYGDPETDEGGELGMQNARRTKLNRLIRGEQAKFAYDYDFGDNWQHVILVEKVLPAETDVRYPRCLTGRRACPPEDVGGVWGYQEFLEAIGNPEHEQHEELLDWVDGEFDPTAFDLAAVNAALQHLA